MADRRAHRLLRDIAALRTAQRMSAHQELAVANECEKQAQDASHRAGARIVAAAQAWDTHLGSAAFAPEFARALGTELVEYGREGVSAAEQCETMMAARRAAEDVWQDGNAHCRLAERAVTDSRRALSRDRDERMLAAQADRTISRWRRA